MQFFWWTLHVRAVERGGKAGIVAGRSNGQQSVTVRYGYGKDEDVTFEALAELMAAADTIARDSSRRRN